MPGRTYLRAHCHRLSLRTRAARKPVSNGARKPERKAECRASRQVHDDSRRAARFLVGDRPRSSDAPGNRGRAPSLRMGAGAVWQRASIRHCGHARPCRTGTGADESRHGPYRCAGRRRRADRSRIRQPRRCGGVRCTARLGRHGLRRRSAARRDGHPHRHHRRPCADTLARSPTAGSFSGSRSDGHGKPQPPRRQRPEGVLGRRDADPAAARPAHRSAHGPVVASDRP